MLRQLSNSNPKLPSALHRAPSPDAAGFLQAPSQPVSARANSRGPRTDAVAIAALPAPRSIAAEFESAVPLSSRSSTRESDAQVPRRGVKPPTENRSTVADRTGHRPTNRPDRPPSQLPRRAPRPHLSEFHGQARRYPDTSSRGSLHPPERGT